MVRVSLNGIPRWARPTLFGDWPGNVTTGCHEEPKEATGSTATQGQDRVACRIASQGR
jgi:hypothetical protein